MRIFMYNVLVVKKILHETSYFFPDENMKKIKVLLIYSGLECCENVDIHRITDQHATN